MSEDYEPELGQMAFGQPHQQFKVSPIVDAALGFIRERLEVALWNVHQREKQTPFANAGETFTTDVFDAQAYSWADDAQPYNFKWGAVEISWYKYLGRGMSANMKITPEMAEKMLIECVASISAW